MYGKAALTGPAVTLGELIARGGILLLAVGLSAGAIADLLMVSEGRFTSFKIGAGSVCLANLLAAATFYTFVSDVYTISLQQGSPLEESMSISIAAIISTFSYTAAVVTGGACVVVAGLAEKATMEEAEKRKRDSESIENATEAILARLEQDEQLLSRLEEREDRGRSG